MYQRFYGLRRLPFELTSDPDFLYYTRGHRDALSNLQYGLSGAKAVTVLVGEAGTGKTTLLHAALQSDPCRHVRCLYINNPALTRVEFLHTLAAWFALGADAAGSKAVLLESMERALRERLDSGVTTALVIDEAQRLSAKLLEEVRLLVNIETPARKLLPLVLAGQPELTDRLNEPGFRQLKQRVVLRLHLQAFTVDETAAYIASRVRTAGGDSVRLFTREAVIAIHEHARGIPGTISVICDNALLTGMALAVQPVGREIVASVVKNLDLSGPARSENDAAIISSDVGAAAPAPTAPEPGTSPVDRSGIAPKELNVRSLLSRDDAEGGRPSLQLDDLDATLAEPEVASDAPEVDAPRTERRGQFRLFGARG